MTAGASCTSAPSAPAIRLSLRARWPGAAGSSADRGVEQPAVIGFGQLLGEDPAGDRDGHVGGLLPDLGQGLIAGRADVAGRPLLGRLGLGLGWLDDLLGRLSGRPAAPCSSRPRTSSAARAICLRCSARSLSLSLRARSVSCSTCSRCFSRSCRACIKGFQANLVRIASRPTKTTSVQIARVGSAFMGFGPRPRHARRGLRAGWPGRPRPSWHAASRLGTVVLCRREAQTARRAQDEDPKKPIASAACAERSMVLDSSESCRIDWQIWCRVHESAVRSRSAPAASTANGASRSARTVTLAGARVGDTLPASCGHCPG